MYGSGYSGFTPWAAATHLPPALKAIAVAAPMAPGIDMPMESGIFHNSAYRWLLRGNAPDDDEVWRSLDQKWYASGRRYRELDVIHGVPDPIFIRWLNHPSYDRYWQVMVPYREQFAHIDIPVLTMTGYFAASDPGAMYYFNQHHKFNPRADHTLFIGPYDEDGLLRGASAELHGFEVDPAALIDLRELRYQWFDHVLKGAELPSLLKDRVNYEVMGDNEWRHAASFEAMTNGSLRFYLDAAALGDGHRMTQRKNAHAGFVGQTLRFTDCSHVRSVAAERFRQQTAHSAQRHHVLER